MLIYFDESYDNEHRYLILGALFNPHPKYLHREWLKIKSEFGAIGNDGKALEIKYGNCTNRVRQDLCCEAINIFIKSTSYFRCIVVDQNLLDLERFGQKHEDKKIKMARAYKKFAELLISHNTENIYNGVLLTDELSRCNGDKFMEIMKQDFCVLDGKHCNDRHRPTLKHIADIKSHLENYQVNQINDILIGCVLNNLRPTTKEFKNNVRKYLIKQLGVNDLSLDTWSRYSKRHVEEYYPKFNVWYWRPGGN